ncbi:MAG TPA: hypothetical protein VH188_07785 [Chthoniobacterales bacterium]|jgi:hypothetical protein|nr:hypothetical protein [Chthoniobacterales bacterium]
MPRLSNGLNSSGIQVLVIAVAAAVLALAGFETGRHSIDAAAIERTIASQATPQHSSDSSVSSRPFAPPERDHIIIRDIATVPFSELYDVLKSASREELFAWATDLERMPRGPRQRAAVTAYYKSLIQVNPRAAIDAVLQARNLGMRDVAIDALTKAAPESIWGDLAEMLVHLPHPRHNPLRENEIFWNWSCVDPEALSQFIEKHPANEEDVRSMFLFSNWGAIDPIAARDWLEADASRQTKGAFRSLVGGWSQVDRAGAMEYAVANAVRPNFDEALNGLELYFVRKFPDDATTLILRLPQEQALTVMKAISQDSEGQTHDVLEDYEKPPELIAPWMVTQPLNLWNDSIGSVVSAWMMSDADAATAWLNQLPNERRDPAIADFCRGSSDEFRDRAIALGFTISDPRLRDQAMGEFARRLGETREEAIAAIDQLPISQEQKLYLGKVMAETANEP